MKYGVEIIWQDESEQVRVQFSAIFQGKNFHRATQCFSLFIHFPLL